MTICGEAIGLDFGTTNTVLGIGRSDGVELLAFDGPQGSGEVFGSALSFWHDDAVRGGLASEAGPWSPNISRIPRRSASTMSRASSLPI